MLAEASPKGALLKRADLSPVSSLASSGYFARELSLKPLLEGRFGVSRVVALGLQVPF